MSCYKIAIFPDTICCLEACFSLDWGLSMSSKIASLMRKRLSQHFKSKSSMRASLWRDVAFSSYKLPSLLIKSACLKKTSL